MLKFLRTPQHRNKYVLRRQTGHPGNSYTVVFATCEDLRELGQKLVEQAQTARISISNYATYEYGRTSRVYLDFRSATAQEMDDWHRRSLKLRLQSCIKPLFYLTLWIFAVIGFRSLVKG